MLQATILSHGCRLHILCPSLGLWDVLHVLAWHLDQERLQVRELGLGKLASLVCTSRRLASARACLFNDAQVRR
jgi:hypothetical protein